MGGKPTTAGTRLELVRLREGVIACRKCLRLVKWREKVAREKVARFRKWEYWGKPLPGFGDPGARMLVVGLAPAAHGGNRTGRIFTGDRSGDWLYRALWKAGFANQPISVSRDDGLTVKECYVTAAVRCAPPGNKPLPGEFRNCRPYLEREIQLLVHLRVIIGLGKLAFDSVIDACRELGITPLEHRPPFKHGTRIELNERLTLIASFHPSQRNTQTGKLTEPMFDAVFRAARARLGNDP